MQIIKGKEKTAEVLFTIGIILELIVMMTDHFASWTLPYRGRATHVAFVLFCLKILMTKYDYKQICMITLAGILGVASYFTCGDEYVIRAVVFVAAFKDVNYKRILRVVLYGTMTGTVIIVVLALLGICGDIVEIRDFGRGVEEARYRLGFNHANNVHDVFWYMISLYILIRRDKMKCVDYLVMTVANIGLYLLTASRTGFASAQSIILGIAFISYLPFVKKWLLPQIVCIIALVSTVFLTVYGSIYNVVESGFVAKADRILNSRMEMLTEHANFKQWLLFPPSRSAEFVDNGFSSVIYCYGTVIGVLFIFAILIKILMLIKSGDAITSVVFFGAILVTFMEATFVINISLLCNLLLILFVCDNRYVNNYDI